MANARTGRALQAKRDEIEDRPLSSPAAQQLTHRLADPVDVFDALCWARARLWGDWEPGYDDLIATVDTLWEAAESTGVIARVGIDATQTRLAAAFQPYRGAV